MEILELKKITSEMKNVLDELKSRLNTGKQGNQWTWKQLNRNYSNSSTKRKKMFFKKGNQTLVAHGLITNFIICG